MTKISAMPQDTAPSVTDSVATLDAETNSTKRTLLSAIQTLFFASAPAANLRLVGELTPYAGYTAPSGWLMCDGTAVSRTTYSALFAILNPSLGTFTTTIATPAVLTLTAHGLQTGDQVYLTTTGALPTGLAQNTLYYAVRIDANTFNLATSRANAYAATKIATSGTQSGTHTLRAAPYGLGDGSTTFNLPDARGRTLAGNDSMSGSVASRLTAFDTTNGVYGNLGAGGGLEKHQLTTAQLASHSHTTTTSLAANGTLIASAAGAANSGAATGVNNAGGDAAHNNTQPTLITNYLIKT